MNRRGRAWLGQHGTAALETMVVMSFLFTLIFGFVHICLFVVTKSMANYAAFTEMRTSMVAGPDQVAARQVMSEMQWWRPATPSPTRFGARCSSSPASRAAPLRREAAEGGARLVSPAVRLSDVLGGLGLVRVIGFAPAPKGNDVTEEGDNQ